MSEYTLNITTDENEYALVIDQPTTNEYLLKLVIETGEKGDDGAAGPKGDQGAQGVQGVQGPQGIPGVGVPTGGTTGQKLVKNSNDDYDTEWADDNPVSSGGHTIYDADGNPLEQQEGLQFIGADIINEYGKTKVTLGTEPFEIELPGTNLIPFDRPNTKIAPITITGAITLGINSANSKSGFCTIADFIGNGSGTIAFDSNFIPINGIEADAFVNTDGYVSTYLFSKVGEYTYTYMLIGYKAIPSEPTVLDAPNLSMAVISSSVLRALWENVLNNSGYQIRISTDNGVTFGTPIDLSQNITQYDITGLGVSVRRDTQARTIGDGITHLTSDWSTTAFATTSNLTQLSAPVLNALTVVSSTQINVSWSQITNNVGYDIYRSIDGGDYTYYANTSTNVNSLNVTGLTANIIYGFKVVAKGDEITYLNSDQSAAETATTKNVAPTLISASTNATGTIIYAVFSREMADSPASVGVSTTPSKTILSVVRNSSDYTKIEITVSTPYSFGELILANFPQWSPADGGDNYAGVSNTIVTNNILAVSLLSNGTTDYINTGYTWPTFLSTDTVEIVVRGSNLIPTTNGTARAVCGSQTTTTPFGRIYFTDTTLYVGVNGYSRPSVATEIKLDYRLTVVDKVTGFVDGTQVIQSAYTGATLAAIVGKTPYLYAQNYNNSSMQYPANVSISEYIIKINGIEVVHMVAQAAGYFYDTVRGTTHYNRGAASNLYPLTVG